MSRQTLTVNRPQVVLQSYLDTLLLDVGFDPVEEAVVLPDDDFEAAVREERALDAARREVAPAPAKVQPVPVKTAPVVTPVAELAPLRPLVLPTIRPAPVVPEVPVVEAKAEPALELTIDEPFVAPVEPEAFVEPATPEVVPLAGSAGGLARVPDNGGPPSWAEEPFECLLFDVAGLKLAVPLVCLGTIHPLADKELTPLFGQPQWFLGMLPTQTGNLNVIDAARWVMPERYRDDFREGLQYVISVQGCDWGLAVHSVSHSIRLHPDEIKWRGHRSQRPWLAGTVIEHMCALLDVAALAELLASGAIRQMAEEAPKPAAKEQEMRRPRRRTIG